MLPAGGIQGGLSPINSLLPPLALFPLSRRLLGAFALSPLPLLLERERGLAIRRIVKIAPRLTATSNASTATGSAARGTRPSISFGMPEIP